LKEKLKEKISLLEALLLVKIIVDISVIRSDNGIAKILNLKIDKNTINPNIFAKIYFIVNLLMPFVHQK
tara:strand:+ start:6120 stop:6326 length:207 start_codon:yes stop_codon:yes gene_type:complete